MSKYRYGVILDAGSSGTRVHIYRWLKTVVARAVASESQLHQLPVVKTKNKKWTMKVHPGISTFGDKTDLVGPDHLKKLFEFALDVVPESEVLDTSIFLLATAGMRLLEDLPRRRLLEEVCRYAKSNTPFRLGDCDEHFQVITGETEGLYGWIAANYLVGGFNSPYEHDHTDGHSTYGFLDMGGASAQIAFRPNSTETEKHANDLQLLRMRHIDGTPLEYKVFVTTFLGYGANEARRRFIESLEEAHDTSASHQALPDPCLPVGLALTKDLTVIQPGSPENEGIETYLLGTGKFSECLASTYSLLDKEATCIDAPCLFHGVHVPAIDFNINHFIGVSNFWHGTHEIFEMGHKDHTYDLATYQSRVLEFCSADWSTLADRIEDQEWGDHVGEEEAAEACFKASWIINMLHDGIGVPRVGLEPTNPNGATNGTTDVLSSAGDAGFLAPFQAVNKIDDTEVEWTLGKMILYASSQVPPIDSKMLDVGFGTNVPSDPMTLPSDFQRGGSEPDVFSASFNLDNYGLDVNDNDPDYDDYAPTKQSETSAGTITYTDSTTTETDSTDMTHTSWPGKLLHAANTSRTPGYALFALILVVVCVLLCGRDRRASLIRKLSHSTLRQRRGKKLPFGLGDNSVKYERLLEEGGEEGVPDPEHFEMGRFGSDDDDDDADSATSSGSLARGRSGNGNGAVTPRRGVVGSPFAGAGEGWPGNGNGFGNGNGLNGGGSGLGVGLGVGVRGKESVD